MASGFSLGWFLSGFAARLCRAHDPELLELRGSFLGLGMLDQFTVKECAASRPS